MPFEAQKFEDRLLGTHGFSEVMLKNHFTLYEGYVKNANTIVDTLSQMLHEKKTGTPEYNELKRRFGWEFNGMRLHELYFWNMNKTQKPLTENSDFVAAVKDQFGSWDNWLTDFKASGTIRGIGWTVLYLDMSSKRLFNTWVSEHDTGHLAGANPLLVLDVFEHAYILDFGLKRVDYIDAFLQAIDWEIVNKRFNYMS